MESSLSSPGRRAWLSKDSLPAEASLKNAAASTKEAGALPLEEDRSGGLLGPSTTLSKGRREALPPPRATRRLKLVPERVELNSSKPLTAPAASLLARSVASVRTSSRAGSLTEPAATLLARKRSSVRRAG